MVFISDLGCAHTRHKLVVYCASDELYEIFCSGCENMFDECNSCVLVNDDSSSGVGLILLTWLWKGKVGRSNCLRPSKKRNSAVGLR